MFLKKSLENVLFLQELLAKGNLWTKEMEMRLTDNDVVLLDGETQVMIIIIIIICKLLY